MTCEEALGLPEEQMYLVMGFASRLKKALGYVPRTTFVEVLNGIVGVDKASTVANAYYRYCDR